MIKEKLTKLITKRNIIIGAAALCAVILVIVIINVSGGKKQSFIWYVDSGLEETWARIISDLQIPDTFKKIQVWDTEALPAEPGILISVKPWITDEKVKVFHRLSWDLEYEGAITLALDPWMIFSKHINPQLSYNRVYSNAGGGVLLIPGRDIRAVNAWTSRFIQRTPGSFPAGDQIWRDWENQLYELDLFPSNMHGYDWYAVLFRLMSDEIAWVYAPLSEIRRLDNPLKSILEAYQFPESGGGESSLLVEVLWALPVNTEKIKNTEDFEYTAALLKTPQVQTVIADSLDWIPADPYGTPFDPVSFSSQRNWLTVPWIYSIYQ